MPVLYALILLAAFEPGLPLGAPAGMLAGTAHPDWRPALTHNPALAADAPCRALAAGYWRPHGLAGVDHAGLAGTVGSGRWSVVAGLGQLGFDRYRERALGLAGAYRVRPGLAFGTSVNLLAVTADLDAIDTAVGLDAGVALAVGPLRLAAAAARFNRPRFANGDEIPPELRLGFAAEPLEDLAVALDASWAGSAPGLAFGLELRFLPRLALRCGAAYPPLGCAVGLGLAAGPVLVDYAVRYHARLRDSHILGLSLSCW